MNPKSKFFKHAVDSHRGVSIQTLLDKESYFGPFVYYTIYELCAEKLYQMDYKKGDFEEPVYIFHRKILTSTLRANVTKIQRTLDQCATLGLIKYRVNDDKRFEIEVPKLLKLLNRDVKSTRQERVNNASDTRLDRDKDKDKDVDVEEDKHTSKNFTENEVKELENVLRKKLDEKTGFLVSKHALKILQHFGSRESFSKFSERIQKNYEKSKQRDIKSLESYMVGAIHKEIDLYD